MGAGTWRSARAKWNGRLWKLGVAPAAGLEVLSSVLSTPIEDPECVLGGGPGDGVLRLGIDGAEVGGREGFKEGQPRDGTPPSHSGEGGGYRSMVG